jgi:hypothetical protein
MAGLTSFRADVRLSGKKTDRKVDPKFRRKAELGIGIDRTPFKFKDWKIA